MANRPLEEMTHRIQTALAEIEGYEEVLWDISLTVREGVQALVAYWIWTGVEDNYTNCWAFWNLVGLSDEQVADGVRQNVSALRASRDDWLVAQAKTNGARETPRYSEGRDIGTLWQPPPDPGG